MTERILDYQLSTIGGLEDIVADELRAVLGGRARSVQVERGETGRILFQTDASPRRLLELRCPTAIDALAGRAFDVTVGPPGLQRILRCLADLPLAAMQRLARACDAEVDVDRADLYVSLQGAHRFRLDELRAAARDPLLRHGLALSDEPGGLSLGLHVRRRRALVTLRLGARRPAGHPAHEGWPGPAQACVARLLDLEPGVLLVGAADRRRELSICDEAAGSLCRVRSHIERLPLANGELAVLLLAADPARASSALAEACRAVAPGGILAVVVPRAETLAAHLRAAGLPLEVMATIPFYQRRRRGALFLLERLELLGIETDL